MTVVALLVWRWLRCTAGWKKRIRLLDGRRAEDGSERERATRKRWTSSRSWRDALLCVWKRG